MAIRAHGSEDAARARLGGQHLAGDGDEGAQARVAVARLPDELVVHVAPILLGGGIRLYGDGMQPVALRLVDRVEAGQLTSLRLAVER